MIKVWDVWIRLFHWSLAILVIFLIVSGSTGLGFYDWHRNAGELVVALVFFRIIWSFIGSSNASLVSLVTSPAKAVAHLKHLFKGDAGQHRGHNSAGGWAVLVMLFLLLVQGITGFFIADEDELVEGAFYGVFSSAQSELLHDIHHWNASLLQAVVYLHVFMIVGYFLFTRTNLLTPMITGKMPWSGATAAPSVKFGRWWVGLLLLIVVLVVLKWVVG